MKLESSRQIIEKRIQYRI